ncbi:hypothetical protein BSAF29S_04297 [Bacillus safensis subsp. safensis]
MANQPAATKQGTGSLSLLIILMAGLFVAILNQTLLNVAMPHLMTEFNVSATTIQWLTNRLHACQRCADSVVCVFNHTFWTAQLIPSGYDLVYTRYIYLRHCAKLFNDAYRPFDSGCRRRYLTAARYDNNPFYFPPENRGKEWGFLVLR